jgi:hypothetical protein
MSHFVLVYLAGKNGYEPAKRQMRTDELLRTP